MGALWVLPRVVVPHLQVVAADFLVAVFWVQEEELYMTLVVSQRG